MCGKYNHLANVCGTRGVAKLHKIVTEDSEEALMTLTITPELWCTVSEEVPCKIHRIMKVEGRSVKFQLDTRFTCNILSQSDLPPRAHTAKTAEIIAD